KRWAKIPQPSPSWPWLCQTTTNEPSGAAATAGAPWQPATVVLTRTSVPRRVPSLFQRWRKTSASWVLASPEPPLCQTVTKLPEESKAAAGPVCEPAVVALTGNSAPVIEGWARAGTAKAREAAKEATQILRRRRPSIRPSPSVRLGSWQWELQELQGVYF